MAPLGLLDCPAELRQQILNHCLPNHIHNAGVAPKTATLLPLLLTCKVIKLDVLALLASWSPLYHIENPAALITSSTTSRRQHLANDEESHMRRISLRLFAKLDPARMHAVAPMGAVDADVFDLATWLGSLASLSRAAVESITVDLTPAPMWMVTHRPDWVRAAVLDNRNRVLLAGCAADVRELVQALRNVYGAGVSIQLGGVVPRKARAAVEEMMVSMGAELVKFTGEWLSGPSEVPTRLSLVLISHSWGIKLNGPSWSRWSEQRMVQIRNEARKEGLAMPDLDLGLLPPVRWSHNSCTAYYTHAQEDEERTRGELVRLLAWAVGLVRASRGASGAVAVDFAPAVKARRFLLHCLARDLGLASVSIGDAGERFVRVSGVAEADPVAIGDDGQRVARYGL